MQTIETKVSKAILQQNEPLFIGRRMYRVAPPSTATLIMVSEEISKLPKKQLNSEKIVEESLAIAKECRVLGDIVAILVLGARRASNNWFASLLRGFKRQRLARRVLEQYSPKELHALLARLLQGLDVADFFALTTFLLEINLLSPTKVEKETTAFGQ